MRTPEEYTRNLKNHVITMQMLEDCLFSVNTRASNWRDKEREYREYRHDYYDNVTKARCTKEAYYHQKDIMLAVLNPVCIHVETYTHCGRERFYDYEEEYWDYLKAKEFVHRGSYWDNDEKREVEFGDVEVEYDPTYRYYLFYDLGGKHTFHTPINEDEVGKYELEIKNIDHIISGGFPVSKLLSTQFVSKVVALIKSKDYQLIGNAEQQVCAKAV